MKYLLIILLFLSTNVYSQEVKIEIPISYIKQDTLYWEELVRVKKKIKQPSPHLDTVIHYYWIHENWNFKESMIYWYLADKIFYHIGKHNSLYDDKIILK